MAAPLSRNWLLKTQHTRRSSPQPWRIAGECYCSIRNPIRTVGNQFHQSKSFSYFTHSILQKIKKVHFSSLSSKTTSSSHQFRLVGWYLGMLHSRPIVTKSVTSALIYTAADLSSQTIVGDEYDLIRTMRMAGYGMLIVGPATHYWYTFMSRAFPNRDVLSTLKKMASGQIVFGPSLTAVFFSVNAALQGENGSEVIARLKRDLIPTMINGIMYWPICDFITFKFIPVHLQPLAANSCSYLWTIYITYMASLEKASPA